MDSAWAMRSYPTSSFRNGALLFLRGDEPDFLYIIERGEVKVYTITADGSEHQVTFLGPGEDFPIGFSAGIAKSVEYFYEVYSRECVLRRIPRSDFIQLLKKDSQLLLQFYVRHDIQLRLLLAHIEALDHSKASDKVAFILMQISKQIGTRLGPHKDRLKLAVTQQDIADMIGLTRETTGIELKKLELKNIISHTRKSYILFIERLTKHINNR